MRVYWWPTTRESMIGVVHDACDSCELQWPELTYACTLAVSRRVWPSLNSHSLPFVAATSVEEIRRPARPKARTS